MAKRKNGVGQGRSVGFILLVLTGLGLLIGTLLRGRDVTLFNPKGLIAGEQSSLIQFVVVVMLTLAIPTLLLFYFFAWKYRETNSKTTYDPSKRYGKLFLFSLWAVPGVFLVILASAMWPAAHKLDPHKTITADTRPLTVQVIALRWKWLFIYPEQHIATVNFVQVPVDTPVQFELTADEAPMSSFWVPHLGGQLYAMTGHTNQLNLMADTAGDYMGQSAEINGAGFAGMKFTARASSRPDFDRWVQDVGRSANVLDSDAYEGLLKPSENNPAALYAEPVPGLYDIVLMKYGGSHDHQGEQ
jgi:cytochrome o ubiquinol oxidase subunit 2